MRMIFQKLDKDWGDKLAKTAIKLLSKFDQIKPSKIIPRNYPKENRDKACEMFTELAEKETKSYICAIALAHAFSPGKNSDKLLDILTHKLIKNMSSVDNGSAIESFVKALNSEQINATLIPKIMSKSAAMPGGVTSLLLNVLTYIDAELSDENLDDLVKFSLKRSSGELMEVLAKFNADGIVAAILDSDMVKFGDNLAKILSSTDVTIHSNNKLDATINSILTSFKKEKSADEALAILISKSTNRGPILEKLMKYLSSESRRVLQILLKSNIDLSKSNIADIRKLITAKKQSAEVIVLASYLSTDAAKLSNIDASNEYAYLIPKIFAKLEKVDEQIISQLIQIATRGVSSGRKSGYEAAEQIISKNSKYSIKLIEALYAAAQSNVDDLHVGAVRKLANLCYKNLANKSEEVLTKIIKLLHYHILKYVTSATIEIILFEEEYDLEKFASYLLSDDMMTVSVLKTLVYFDHDVLPYVTSSVVTKLEKSMEEMNSWAASNWAQINLPKNIPYKDETKSNDSPTTAKPKKHMTEDELWEEQVRKDLNKQKQDSGPANLSEKEQEELNAQVETRGANMLTLSNVLCLLEYVCELFIDDVSSNEGVSEGMLDAVLGIQSCLKNRNVRVMKFGMVSREPSFLYFG